VDTRVRRGSGIVGRAVTLRGEPHTIVGVVPPPFDPMLPATSGHSEAIADRRRRRRELRHHRPAQRRRELGEADGQVALAAAEVVRDRYRNSRYAVRLGLLPMQRGLTEDTRVPILVLWQRWAWSSDRLRERRRPVAGTRRARAQEIATRIALGGGRAAIVRSCSRRARARRLRRRSRYRARLRRLARVRDVARRRVRHYRRTRARRPSARDFCRECLLTSIIFGLCRRCKRAASTFARRWWNRVGRMSRATPGAGPPRDGGTEVALGVVLLVGAGLLIRTFDYLVSKPAGFDGTHVLTATLSLQTRDTKPATAWCSCSSARSRGCVKCPECRRPRSLSRCL